MSRNSAILRDGVILNNRYRIVKQIGRGGFGTTYLAEDTHRYRELCVLKEFAPQVKSDRELRKAEELFEREAGILYKLKHRQIPKFEALLHTRIDHRRSLFLVQEYIEGEDYWQLLRRRSRLSEAEVTAMIWDLLPVLGYIHGRQLIHRDISPDNLIYGGADKKTVLIDFGCVKVAANAISKSTGHSVTLIGKKGYSPNEQIYRGQAFPSSDLYSLAATAVVLLTGKQPNELYDSHQGKWDWESAVRVSSNLTKVLNKMLAEKPGDRYQSAEQVLQALKHENNSIVSSFISRVRTLVVAPGDLDSDYGTATYRHSTNFTSRIQSNISRVSTRVMSMSRRLSPREVIDLQRVKPIHWGMVFAGVLFVPGLLSFALTATKIVPKLNLDSNPNSTQISLGKNEQDLQQDIYQRVKSLNIDASAFYKQVDQAFQNRYPEMTGLTLTGQPEHQSYRQKWYEIASDLLNKEERTR